MLGRVLGEGDTVRRVGNVLVLRCSSVEGVYGDEAVLRIDAIIKETGVVVSVKDRATAEYAITMLVWSDGDRQVLPGVEIARCHII